MVGPPLGSPLTGYVAARAASLTGDHGEAARRYIALLALDPANAMLAASAIGESIRAGDTATALRLSERRPLIQLPAEARFLLVADALRRRDSVRAVQLLRDKSGTIDLSFLEPLVSAWIQAERGDAQALVSLKRVTGASAASTLLPEQRALIQLRLGHAADADPDARRAIAAGGGREDRVRLAMAQGFLRLHDTDRATQMLGGSDQLLALARAQLAAGRLTEGAVDTGTRAFAQMLAALAIELNSSDNRSLAL